MMYTDKELKIAYEDGCKYQNFNDLKGHLKELRQILPVSNLLPDKDILRLLFIDFFTYHNSANKNSKEVEDYFDTWYNWKILENSNLDEPLTKW